MMENWLGRLLFLATIMYMASIWTSCTEPSPIGAGIVGELGRMEADYTDTLNIVSRSRRDDSLFTYLNNSYLLGSMQDSEFGRSYAGIYGQLRLPSNNIDLGDGLKLDSAVLNLVIRGTYGDKTAKHDLIIYQLSDEMNVDERYRSYNRFSYDPLIIGRKKDVFPFQSDSTHVSIRLEQSFGEMLLNQSGTLNFASNTSFLNFLRGIYIAPDTTNGYSRSMMYVDILDGGSSLTLHYSNMVNDSLSMTMVISPSSALSNFYHHGYDNQNILDQIQGMVIEDSINYIQGMSGLSVNINIPHIKNLGAISVMKAQLVITQIPDSAANATYGPPAQILPKIRLDSSLPYFSIISDEEFSLAASFYNIGGKLEEEEVNGKTYNRYKIELVRLIQEIVQSDTIPDIPLELKIIPAEETPHRLIIGGGNHPNPELRMKLNLFYVKI